MSLDPTDLFAEDLYEPTKIYLFGKKFNGLKLGLADLAKTPYTASKFNSGDAPMPPGVLEQEFRRERYGEEINDSKLKMATVNKDKTLHDAQIEVAAAQNALVTGRKDLEPELARIYSFSYEGNYYKLSCPMIYMVWGHGIPPEHVDVVSGLPMFFTRNTGIEGKDWRFGSDIRVWKLDQTDRSICIDLDIGTLKEILLEPAFSDGEGGNMSSRGRMNSRGRMASRGRMVGSHQD